jgi:D-aspartate ligase
VTRPDAVVLGGRASGLAVIRALGREGIRIVSVCHSEKEYGRLSRYVARVVRAPDPELHADDYVAVLESLAAEHPGALLVPASDESLMLVAMRRKLLERHFRVGCMDWERVGKCVDKAETYALAERYGVPGPRTFRPASVDELEDCGRLLGFPCLVKPRLSHVYSRVLHRKMDKVETLAALRTAWRQADDQGLGVLVQEFIPGPDHNGANYNSYTFGDVVWAECTAQKLRSLQPEVGSPRVVLSRHIPEVIGPGRRILRAVGLEGFANVEFKRDVRDGVFRLMEINCRHNMSAALSVRCGVNFPLIEYRHRIEGLRTGCGTVAAGGVYWINLISDLREGVALVLRRRTSLRYFRPYANPHVYDYLDGRDPRPFTKAAQAELERSWSMARSRAERHRGRSCDTRALPSAGGAET